MKTLARIAASFSFTALLFAPALSQYVIVSQPVTVAAVGHLYTYQVQAASLSARAVVDTPYYHLTMAPSGMTIDSTKGLVQWVPKTTGIFRVEIAVTSRLSRKASQQYDLTVVRFFGTIAGTVRDTSGHGIPRVVVSLFPIQPSSVRSPIMPIWGTLMAVTDSIGRYTISPIDSGIYYAAAMSICNILMIAIPCPYDDYVTVYYKDSPSVAGATPIPVKDSNAVRIDFVMHKRAKPVSVTISGTVKDSSGKAVAGASVIVSPIRICPVVDDGAVGNIGGPVTAGPTNIDGYADVVSSVRTDSSGYYKASVLAGGPYVVECIAQGYLIQFYKQKNNVLEADRLTLSRDSSGVNFKLVALPKATAKVSGVVRDSSGKGVASNVVLYSRGPSLLSAVFPSINARTIRTDTLGNFVFENIPNGAYVLQAIPLRGYLPAYYSKNACGEIQWKKADTILVKGNDILGLSVCVRKATVRGAGTITGRISVPDGSPLSGVVILAESQGDPSVVTYAVSDVSGNYELANLDPGMYSISPDKVGFVGPGARTSNVVYGQNALSENLQMTAEVVTSVTKPVVDALPQTYNLSQNYPNPFNPSTVIEFSLPKPGIAMLKVYNVLGQQVRVLIDGYLEAGVHRVEFSAVGGGEDLPSGTYLYQLDVNGNRLVRKMMVVK